ncbi:chloride channel protein [Streptomyces sp. NPDC059740]|uniref:chloride channel protein n=1 Tax=Streptomyces sp. NPDC059740 TaxID=3346926 RepID=UPI0036645590
MAQGTGPAPAGGAEVAELVGSRRYLALLVLAAVIGAPVSAVAYGFLALVGEAQPWLAKDVPRALGFGATPLWWPVPLLAVGGLLTALAVRYLPGTGGHEPTAGFTAGTAPSPAALPGVVAAALATLVFGAVLGPEAPLIALGGGLAAASLRLSPRPVPEQAGALVGAAGSFAAISALLGSPLLGAFLLMEVAGVGGATLGAVLVPGLLAAGVGSLVFTGLGSWTGLGTYSLTLHDVPKVGAPTAAELGWAVVVGLAGALVGAGVRWCALRAQAWTVPRRVPATVLLAVGVGLLAVLYTAGSGGAFEDVLYSGQSALGPLLDHGESRPVGELLLLLVCKGLAYAACLACLRGGPIFPALYLGAAGGLALSHLPGLSLVAGFATGLGAMAVAMLGLPMTSVLLATLLLGHGALRLTPLVIVAVVVSYATTRWLAGRTAAPAGGRPAAAGAGTAAGDAGP